jgi:alpha-tubulin suppressor-like RCC1 family protein
LGIGDYLNQNIPFKIDIPNIKITKILSGSNHNILLNNNKIYVFGSNNVKKFYNFEEWPIRIK